MKSGVRLSLSEFIERAIAIHGDRYDYSEAEYVNSRTKLCIICSEHGEFWQAPSNHVAGNGCPMCAKSNGEQIIDNFLKHNNIEYVDQYSVDGLVGDSGSPLRFDFYIPSGNLIVEYDGKQHYEYIPSFHSKHEYELLRRYDNMKERFCERVGLKLIRIRYNDNVRQKIEEIFYEDTGD